MANIKTGTDADDILFGTAYDDVIDGGLGNDTLYAGSGSDRLTGGAGANHFAFRSGDGMDTITDFVDGQDTLEIRGAAWSDVTISSVEGGTLVTYGEGDSIFLQNVDAANIDQSDFTLVDADSADVIEYNTLYGPLNTVVIGGTGIDTLRFVGPYNASIGANAQLIDIEQIQLGDAETPGHLRLESGGLYNFSAITFLDSTGDIFVDGTLATKVTGSAQDDSIISNSGDDTLDGGLGDDYIWGDAGDDRIFGRDGDDHLVGSSGGDLLSGSNGSDTLDGGEGRDSLYGGGGDDLILHETADGRLDGVVSGGAGIDTLKFTGRDNNRIGADAELRGIEQIQLGVAGQDEGLRLEAGGSYDFSGMTFLYSNRFITIDGIEASNLIGSAQDDIISSNYGADTLDGGLGNDYIWADGGNDVVYGQSGNDDLLGNEGEDALFGGAGHDSLDGGVGHDTLDGGAGDDNLFGEDGNDVLTGGDGFDYLIGGDGDDVISGGKEFDYLAGGTGNDTLNGGAYSDVFAFEQGGNADVITDFEVGVDLLEMQVVTQGDITITSVVDGTLVGYGAGDTVLLENVSASELSWDDFIYF